MSGAASLGRSSCRRRRPGREWRRRGVGRGSGWVAGPRWLARSWKSVGDVGGVQRLAGGGGEHEPGVDPGRAGGETFAALPGPVLRVATATVVSSRAMGASLLSVLGASRWVPSRRWMICQRMVSGAGVEVDVFPVQAAGFAAAQSAVGDEVVQGVQPVVDALGVVEERASLFGGPDHDRAGVGGRWSSNGGPVRRSRRAAWVACRGRARRVWPG